MIADPVPTLGFETLMADCQARGPPPKPSACRKWSGAPRRRADESAVRCMEHEVARIGPLAPLGYQFAFTLWRTVPGCRAHTIYLRASLAAR